MAKDNFLGLYDKDSPQYRAFWEFFKILAQRSPDSALVFGDYVLTPLEVIDYVEAQGKTWLWDRILEAVREKAIREKISPEEALRAFVMAQARLTPELEERLVKAGFKRKIEEEAPTSTSREEKVEEEEGDLEEARKEILGRIEESKDRHEIATLLVEATLLGRMVRSLYDAERDSVIGTYCWDGKRWVECEEALLEEAYSIIKGVGLEIKWTPGFREEVREKIIRETWTLKPENDPLAISFNNVVLDWGELQKGNIDGAFKKHDPELWIFHSINWDLEVELLRKALEANSDIEALFKEKAPKSYEAFRSWVDDKWIVLLEIVGYTLYPRYDLHKAIMLVGEGANGKSTYLRLIRHILGGENISSVSLQELSDPENRFSVISLYRKLANIYADLPEAPLRDAGRFKILTGEDSICADRKFRDRICFVNYAKLIFSANRLPQPSEDTLAFWRRWVVINFPHQFPIDKTFYERTFTPEEIKTIIALGIASFLNAWRRGAFSYEGTAQDYKEIWLRNSNPIYNFIATMIERGMLKKDPNEKIHTDTLWNMYIDYCKEEEIEAIPRNRFTMELARLGFPRVRIKNEFYYKGLARVEAQEPQNLGQFLG